MKLTIEHTIPYELSLVEDVILDHYTWNSVAKYMPSLKEVKVIYREEVEGKVCLRKWFVPDITIPWFARGKVKQEMVEWGEMLTWCPQNHSGEFVIEPNIPREWLHHFRCEGKYALESLGENKTRRLVHIDLQVKIPLIGGMAEGYIADRVKEWYAGEANALTVFAAK